MKNFMSKIKTTKEMINSINGKTIDKKINLKASVYTVIILLMIILPISLIFIELFKQFSLIFWFTYVLLILLFIIINIVLALYTVIYFEFLRGLIDNDIVNSLTKKDIFITELLNPLYIILSLTIVVIIYIFMAGIL